jgi:hypothetical protein
VKLGAVPVLIVRKNTGVSESAAEPGARERSGAVEARLDAATAGARSTLERWLIDQRVTLLIGVLAALPVIVSTIHGLSEAWSPYGDRAVIAARSYDVFTAHPPLVGQYSAWSSVLAHPIFSPGPMLYWLLAVPAHFIGPRAMVVTIGLMNVACVVGIIILVRRRGGLPLMAITAIAIVVMCRSLQSQTLHDIWDPTVPLLPLTLLFYLAWSIAGGEYRLLPLAALVASFIVQTHLAFVVATVLVLVVAVAGLLASRVPDRRALRNWSLGAVGVTVVVWIPAFVNQITRPPGNLYLVADAVLNRKGTLGGSPGWNTVARSIGIAPWWLRDPVVGIKRWFEVLGAPGTGVQVSAAVVLASLALVFVIALRRRNVEIGSLTALALALCVALALGTASVPTQGTLALTIGYTLWWASAAGMFVWFALGYSVARLVRPAASVRWRRGAEIAAVAAVAAVAVGFSIAQPPDADRGTYRAFRTVADRLAAALPHSGSVLVTADDSLQGFELQAAVVYALQRDGTTVLLPRSATGNLGSSYLVGARPYDRHVTIGYNHDPPGRVLARVRVDPPAPVTGRYVVSLLPGRAP